VSNPFQVLEPNATAQLTPAPLSNGTTVVGFSGVMICDSGDAEDGVIGIGIVQPDGSVIGALLDARRFDTFCLALAPFVERAGNREQVEAAWAAKTIQ
jgi:hypothetical protein